MADNGSSDGSRRRPRRRGGVVPVPARGYGSALADAARGRSCSWAMPMTATTSPSCRFVRTARGAPSWCQGAVPSGGSPSAPCRSCTACGATRCSPGSRGAGSASDSRHLLRMRAFRAACRELDLRCTGMEYATEMIIKATLSGARISEVPITLWPDARRAAPAPPYLPRRLAHAPLLPGARPRWLFLVPGMLLMLLGVLASAVALPASGRPGALTCTPCSWAGS